MKLLLYTHEFPPFSRRLGYHKHQTIHEISESDMDVVVLTPGYFSRDRYIGLELPFKVIGIPGLGKKWMKKMFSLNN